MRCLDLARTSLNTGQNAPSGASIDDGLGKALAAMKHMAALLQRAMRLTSDPAAPSPVVLFHVDQTLSDALDEITRMLQPLAAANRVTLHRDLSPACANLPVGPLGVVLLNGLRNAIESCAADDHERREVSITTNRDEKDALCIRIEDTGAAAQQSAPQPTANSHGIGLLLSQQIVRELGGELALLIHPDGRGATLRASVPLRSLTAHA